MEVFDGARGRAFDGLLRGTKTQKRDLGAAPPEAEVSDT